FEPEPSGLVPNASRDRGDQPPGFRDGRAVWLDVGDDVNGQRELPAIAADEPPARALRPLPDPGQRNGDMQRAVARRHEERRLGRDRRCREQDHGDEGAWKMAHGLPIPGFKRMRFPTIAMDPLALSDPRRHSRQPVFERHDYRRNPRPATHPAARDKGSKIWPP